MTAAEFAAARKSLGLTQEQMAAWLGVHRVTVTKIETGKQAVTPTMRVLMRLYLAGAKPPREE